MKVPSPVTGNTQPSGQKLGFFDGSASNEAFGAGVGRALQGLGSQVTGLGFDIGAASRAAQERQDKSARFTALKDLADFTTQTNMELEELKRNTPPDKNNYFAAAREHYEKREAEFLARNVPPDLQEEFSFRTNSVKQSILSDAFQFEISQKDSYFREGINTVLDDAKKSIALDPTDGNVAAQESRILETIATSELPEVEKRELLKQAKVAVAALHYKVMNREKALTGTQGAVFDTIRGEEGFRSKPYRDTRTSDGSFAGYRVGYGSDTITFPDGTYRKVRPTDVITREDAERDLRRRVETEFGPRVKSQIGADAFNALDEGSQAALISVAYNYGALPVSVIKASATGDKSKLARAVAGLGANPNRRRREAQLISGVRVASRDNLDTDPRYDVIPFEDRITLRQDAQKEANAQRASEAAQAKELYQTQFNELMTGIHDGRYGQTEIDNARENGWLTDINDILKAESLYEKSVEDAKNQRAFAEAFGNPNYLVTDTKEDRDLLNAGVPDARQRISAGDTNYISDRIVPIAQWAKDIPTDVSDLLNAMARSTNAQQSQFALESLKLLQEQAPEAFNKRIDEAAQKKLDRYSVMSQYMDGPAVQERLRGGIDAADRALRDQLRKDASKIVVESDQYKNITNLFDTAFTFEPSADGSTKAALQQDYQVLFQENYSVMADPEMAHEATTKQLMRIWGPTELGGRGKMLVKYPPQLMGYLPSRENFVNMQVREELGLKPGDTYQLKGDEQTLREFQEYRDGRRSRLPSYWVVRFDENGQIKMAEDGFGLATRWSFEMTDGMKSMERAEFDRKNVEYTYWKKLNEVKAAQDSSLQVPDELLDELKEAEEKYNQLGPTSTLTEADLPFATVPKEATGTLRPFDPGKDAPVQNQDGSVSTEITRTVQVGKKFINVPSLWFQDGSLAPKDLDYMSDDELARFALQYESRSKKDFKRYDSVDAAVKAAKERSNRGGGLSNAN